MPIPDAVGLPSIEVLLRSATDAPDDVIDLTSLAAWVSPSPARAEPHDAAAWLPIPDAVHELPPVHALLDPTPETQAAVIADAEAVINDALAAAEAAVAPSPARAEPHDPTAWLPLPSLDELPAVEELLEPANDDASGTRKPRRGVRRLVPPARALVIALVVVVTVAAGGFLGSRLLEPSGSRVSLLLDGAHANFRTDAATVGDVLAQRHVTLGRGESVVPAAPTSVHNGMRIAVLRAFPVVVNFDGTTRIVRTTQRSADGLAKQLHVGKLVAVRNSPGRLHNGSTVVLRTRMSGSLSVDGQLVTFDSPSHTVGELLDSYHIVLPGDDYVLPPRDAVLTDGARVVVVRVGAETEQGTQPIKYSTVQQPDPNLPIGQTRVLQAGKDGVATVTYRIRTENGTMSSQRVIVSVVPTVPAVNEIIGYGTAADWHWDALAQCESGGRWDTIDPNPNGYDGGLGIYRPNWAAFGGLEFAPNAGLATREQQIIVGMRIYARYGWDPWGCANNVLRWPNRTN